LVHDNHYRLTGKTKLPLRWLSDGDPPSWHYDGDRLIHPPVRPGENGATD